MLICKFFFHLPCGFINFMFIFRENPVVRLDASISSLGLVQELTSSNTQNVSKTDGGLDLFDDMKKRFLNFKEHKYL